MEVFGELKNAYLEKDNAGKTALGAVCCGDSVTSEVDALLTATPNVLVGSGSSSVRLATAPEIVSMDNRLSSTTGRVTILEQLSSSGVGHSYSSIFGTTSGVTFVNCYEQDAHGYRILRLQSSTAQTSEIKCATTFGEIFGDGSIPYENSKIEVSGNVLFNCQQLVWSTDLTQSLCYAAPYTDVKLYTQELYIDNDLFFEKEDTTSPRFYTAPVPSNNMSTGYGGRIDIGIQLSGTSVIFHRENSGYDAPNIVEFVYAGRSYKMTYATYMASVFTLPFNITARFRHNYYGDRDTYAFIYPNYSYFRFGYNATILRI